MPLNDDPWLPYNEDGSVPPIRSAAPIAVYRYDGTSDLALLPNVECLGTAIREGTDPGNARFRYNLASGLSGAPVSIEQALGTGFTGPLVINPGDRLVVQATQPGGTVENLFDGPAISFALGVEPDSEEVFVGAVGIGWHAWDDVIGGAIVRNAGLAESITDVPTEIPAQFNPNGQPNCTPDGYMAGTFSGSPPLDQRYPTFLDHLVIQKPTDLRTYWTLSKACRYILFTENEDETFIANPDGADLDAMLVSPSEYGDTLAPITCPDTPISGKDWPVTINKLVGECGFGTKFALSTDADTGLPSTSFDLFKPQAGTPKSLYLYPRGTTFDPRLFNVQSSGLGRELGEVVNQWTVQGAPDRWEASFILQPAFPMAAGDKAAGVLPSFNLANETMIEGNRYTYRFYIFDECMEGFYSPGTNAPIVANHNLDNLLGKPGTDGVPVYAGRRRVPLGDLVTIEALTGKPYSARLAISKNYTGSAGNGTDKLPGLWDGSGLWQNISTSTWRLSSDRLGIEITDTNPNDWNIGQSPVAGMPYPDGQVHGVEAQCTTGATNFVLRLTCVIEADTCLSQVAVPRGGSPLSQTINRVIDASDRYRNDRVDYPSEFNNAAGGQNINPRNNDAAALAEAQAIRAGTESGVLSGPVVIPRLTTYYPIGTPISQIEGRNLGLRTDQGSGTPVYPVVVGVSYEFGPQGQTTTLELSDAGTDRTKYDRKSGRARPDDAFWNMRSNNYSRSGEPAPGELMGGGGGGVGPPLPDFGTPGLEGGRGGRPTPPTGGWPASPSGDFGSPGLEGGRGGKPTPPTGGWQ